MAKERKQEMARTRRHEGQIPQRIMSPFDEMERMVESLFPERWMQPSPMWPWSGMGGGVAMPAIDIVDRDDTVVLRAELPGIDKDAIDVSVSDDTVTIRGATRHEEKESEQHYYRSEIQRGAFVRTVALPAEVDGDKTKATFRDGILELVMPKLERAKRHSIKVE